jgi:tagatose-1,6-bisphosphate aldolase
MPKIVPNSNSNIAIAVVAGAVGVVAGRFVWKRLKNRKAQK